ncbi:MAG: UvrD-helicase domain-containing protein [Chitinophagales bacterium]|nr:UvrD-helicase domain-containing protein [Chitinophagales bacterium]
MTPTAEQKRIYDFIRYDSNHGVIDAVAGSGKTTTIIESIGYSDADKTLLFCAFNKSIRDEIQRRVNDIGRNNVTVKNLHQLGFDILKSNYGNKYVVEEKKYNQLVKDSLNTYNKKVFERYLSLHDFDIERENQFGNDLLRTHLTTFQKRLRDIIDKFRLTLTENNLDKFKSMVSHFNIIPLSKVNERTIDKEIELLFEANNSVLQEGNTLARNKMLIDLSDMVYLPYEFKLDPITRYDILFVDECQDLSKSQLAVALKYVKKSGRVIAVGDPCQSIYGFTGADINSFRSFYKLPNHVTLSLSYCFRCPNVIIEYAKNFRPDIKPFKDKDGFIERIDFEIVIDKLLPNDLIISRTKAPLTSLMFILLENNIRIDVHQDDIKDLINELRHMFSTEELRMRDIFKTSYDFFEKVKDRNIYFIKKNASKIAKPQEKEEYVENETDYLDRRIAFIKNQLSKHIDVNTINDLLKKIESLVSGGEGAIKLSTIHRAKGLENNRVFILDYDKLPMKKDDHQPWEIEQEHNLKYVALTRAKKTLYLVNSIKNNDPSKDENESLFDSLDGII